MFTIDINSGFLSAGFNNSVVAISDDLAGKLFPLGSSQALEELRLGQVANGYNRLLVEFVEVVPSACFNYDVLIMERVYPLQPRALSRQQKEEMLSLFIQQLKELHDNGFAHWDIKRPDCDKGTPWDNIILTMEGIRLIDTGLSVLDGYPDFEEARNADIEHALEFARWLLAQP